MSSDDEDVTHHHQESAHAQESLVSKSDKEKRPAKESENDKAKLLEEKSDNEVEEDEPEFDDDYTGKKFTHFLDIHYENTVIYYVICSNIFYVYNTRKSIFYLVGESTITRQKS